MQILHSQPVRPAGQDIDDLQIVICPACERAEIDYKYFLCPTVSTCAPSHILLLPRLATRAPRPRRGSAANGSDDGVAGAPVHRKRGRSGDRGALPRVRRAPHDDAPRP